jgi:hypothetical protein
MDSHDNHYDSFHIMMYFSVSLSLFSLFLVNILLSDKHTNSSRLIRCICLSEAMFIYCQFVIIVDTPNFQNFFFNFIRKYLLLN